jgi:hypothetical protein
LGVTHLDPTDAQRVWEAAGDAVERHQPAAEGAGLAGDEILAGLHVGGDQHDRDQGRRDRQQRQQDAERPSQRAFQNASPIPM